MNPDDSHLVTLFRVYPRGTQAGVQYERELTDPECRSDLIRHNQLTEAVGNLLFEWYRTGHKIDGQYTPHMSFSTGFRVATYNQDGADADAVVYALKAFPMNVFVTPDILRWALTCVQAARDAVVKAHPHLGT